MAFAAPPQQSIVNEAFWCPTELCLSEAVVHGTVERCCRSDMDVVETKEQCALSLGLTSQTVDPTVPGLADCLLSVEFVIQRNAERA